MRSEGLPVAVEATDRRAHLGAANVSNTLASLLRQVRCGQDADGSIVDAHKVTFKPSQLPVQENVRDLLLLDLAKGFNGPLGRGNQHDVHTPGQQLLDLLPFQLRILIGGGDEQGIAFLSHFGGDQLGDLREEWMQQIGYDKANGPGLPGDE